MNLPLSTAFTESHKFWVVVFSFSFVCMHILISFFMSSVICWLFRSVFSLHVCIFNIFFSCSLHLILLHSDQKKMLEMISFFFKFKSTAYFGCLPCNYSFWFVRNWALYTATIWKSIWNSSKWFENQWRLCCIIIKNYLG